MKRIGAMGVTTLLGSRLQEAGFIKNPNVTIGDNIRELLERADISPDRLSKLSGVKKSVVHGIISNSCEISHSDVKKLAAVLPDLRKFETAYRVRAHLQHESMPVTKALSEREAVEIVKNPKMLRKHMRDSGISEDGLSERSGVRKDLLREAMEGSKQVYPNTAKKLAQALVEMITEEKTLVREKPPESPIFRSVISSPEYTALMVGLPSPEPVKMNEVEVPKIHPVQEPEPEPEPKQESLVSGLRLDSYIPELTTYFRDDGDDDKATSALQALGIIADASSGSEFTRDELLGRLTPKNWQRFFIKRIKLAGYLDQVGDRRNTKYIPTGSLTTSPPSAKEVVEMIWPGRTRVRNEDYEEQSELDEEIEDQVQSEIPEEPQVDEGFEETAKIEAQGLEGVLMAMKAMFFEALRGQLEVIISHGSQLDRIERKLDTTLRELGVDPESV